MYWLNNAGQSTENVLITFDERMPFIVWITNQDEELYKLTNEKWQNTYVNVLVIENEIKYIFRSQQRIQC